MFQIIPSERKPWKGNGPREKEKKPLTPVGFEPMASGIDHSTILNYGGQERLLKVRIQIAKLKTRKW